MKEEFTGAEPATMTILLNHLENKWVYLVRLLALLNTNHVNQFRYLMPQVDALGENMFTFGRLTSLS